MTTESPADAAIGAAIARVLREEHGRVMAALVAHCGDFAVAEDALQDAFAAALEQWSTGDVPARPAAWLVTVARRRIVDQQRRATAWSAREAAVQHHLDTPNTLEAADPGDIPDERLRLIFTCCHPAIRERDRVALTLRTLCGLTTEQLARAWRVTPATMAQRLVRVQRKIRDAGIPYVVPPASAMVERLDGVLRVVYLVFNEGYVATDGDDLMRPDLVAEAVRLGRWLVELLPDEPEVHGLYALMAFHHARSPARVADDGAIVPLSDQDRSRWLAPWIREGMGALRRSAAGGGTGRFRLEAAISAMHATAPSWATTDHAHIVRLYDALYALQPDPVIALNRAVARAESDGPARALAEVQTLADALVDYQPWYAASADLLRRVGQHAAARARYDEAIERTTNPRERAFLDRRRRALDASSGESGGS